MTRLPSLMRSVTSVSISSWKRWIALCLLGDKIQKVPLRHERDELASCRKDASKSAIVRFVSPICAASSGPPGEAASEIHQGSPIRASLRALTDGSCRHESRAENQSAFPAPGLPLPVRASRYPEHHSGGSAAGDTAADRNLADAHRVPPSHNRAGLSPAHHVEWLRAERGVRRYIGGGGERCRIS